MLRLWQLVLVGLTPKPNIWQSWAVSTAPQNLRGAEDDLSSFSLCFQNILSQTEEGSSRQENAQKALGAVSKVGRREAEEGRGAKWQRGSGGEYAGMGDWILLTRSLSAAALRWGA